jgi:plasmid stabilization system protein ParE
VKYSIKWSEFAEDQLDQIYEYYTEKASVIVAEKIISRILIKVRKLEHSPFIGQLEPRLIKRKGEFRYLVVQNFKVIYAIDSEKLIMRIFDVFDTRQNPSKIQRSPDS